MPKKDVAQELQKEFKKGNLKPSRIKKSKSADNISLPAQTTALTRSKSQEPFADPKYPYTTLIAQAQEIEKLQSESQTKSTTISLLRKKNEELEKALKQSSSPELNSQLDQSLFARHQNLKDWFTQYQKTKKLDKELIANIEQASSELITQDQTISQLRSENFKLKQEKQSLAKDLNLSSRLAESRKVPYFENDSGLSYFKYLVYSVITVGFLLVLMRKRETEHGL